MGSVIDYIDCPVCGHPDCYTDYYYKTGEEYRGCGECGYSFSAVIKNREKALNQLQEEDWEVNELTNPWGSYKLKTANSIGVQCGSFANEDQFKEAKENVFNEIDNVESFIISRFVDGKIIKNLVIENSKIINEIV